jgi:hypothetical protein
MGSRSAQARTSSRFIRPPPTAAAGCQARDPHHFRHRPWRSPIKRNRYEGRRGRSFSKPLNDEDLLKAVYQAIQRGHRERIERTVQAAVARRFESLTPQIRRDGVGRAGDAQQADRGCSGRQ